MNIDAILASQTHHIPQVGFPHKDPVTMEIKVKIIPVGAKLFAIKGATLILNNKFKTDAIPIRAKHPREMKDDGTCTYIILTESPCT